MAYVKDVARYHLNRIQVDVGLDDEALDELFGRIDAAENILEVNAVILGEHYDEAVNPSYDPVYESLLMEK